MISIITHFHNRIWSDIESRLIPSLEGSRSWEIFHAMPLIIEFPAGIAVSCVQTANKILSCVFNFFRYPASNAKEDFSHVVQDARDWEILKIKLLWEKGIQTFYLALQRVLIKIRERFTVRVHNGLLGKNDFPSITVREEVQISLNTIEWSQIEPQEGVWDETILQIYLNLCVHLRNQRIAPMITLHHFSEPLWFHERGSFENEENHEAFIHFSEKIFLLFTKSYRDQPLVEYFCTINEPAVDAFSRFIRGSFSPGIILSFRRAAKFLKGELYRLTSLPMKNLKNRHQKVLKLVLCINISSSLLRVHCFSPLPII